MDYATFSAFCPECGVALQLGKLEVSVVEDFAVVVVGYGPTVGSTLFPLPAITDHHPDKTDTTLTSIITAILLLMWRTTFIKYL